MSRYIDKAELLEWLEKVDGCIADGTVEAPTLYKQIITDIKNFGAADVVEVRHGEWGFDGMGWTCSECGEYALSGKSKMQVGSNFCPHCGAKMDGERREE